MHVYSWVFIENKFHESYEGPNLERYKRYIDNIYGTTTIPKKDLLMYIDSSNFNEAIKIIT